MVSQTDGGMLLVVVFAVLFLDERPSLREWIGIGMVGVGILIMGFKK